MIKFSVLISVYAKDNPVFLKEALLSIYEKQSLKPNQIVIVFDGPLTNDLYDVIDEFKADKKELVTIVKLEKNSGLGNALKEGSTKCLYEYIARMDSDDISLPNRFERLMKFAQDNPNIDAFGSDIAEFSNSPNDKNIKIRSCPATSKGIRKMLKKRSPMNHVSVCLKKESLFKAGGYLGLSYVEDYYLWARMVANGCELSNINEVLVNVRAGDGFLKRRSNKDILKNRKIVGKYLIKNKLMNRFEYCLYRFEAMVFVLSPSWLKKFFYSVFLRK